MGMSPRLAAATRHAAPRIQGTMDLQQAVIRIIDDVLNLHGRGTGFTRQTHLLGAVPEFDSMAVVALVSTLEEQLGISIDDDEISGATFASVGTLVDFVAAKLGLQSPAH
jgi:acyl carrier protein